MDVGVEVGRREILTRRVPRSPTNRRDDDTTTEYSGETFPELSTPLTTLR